MRRAKVAWTGLLGAAALFVACGGDLAPASRITSFRSFAMRATRVVQSDTCDANLVAAADARPGRPAKQGKTDCDVSGSYARPGDEVQLELLWHDPNPSAMRSWLWTTCLLPQSSSVLGCFQKIGQDFARLPAEQRPQFLDQLKQRKGDAAKAFEQNELAPRAADGSSADARTLFRVQVPPDALAPLAGLSPQAKAGALMGIVFLACPGNLVFNFEALATARNALPLKCLDATTGEELGTDKFTIGIKRVFLREKDANEDPGIAGVTWNGQPWPEAEVKELAAACNADEERFDRCDGDKIDLALQLGGNVFEKGVDENGTPFEEQVVVQYYATEGLFEDDVKRAEVPKTRFAARRTKTGEQTMWIVVRDSRGGVRWVTRKFRVK